MTNPTWQKPELIEIPKEIVEAMIQWKVINPDTKVFLFKATQKHKDWLTINEYRWRLNTVDSDYTLVHFK